MELTAVIRALEHATDVTVYTDSRYVKDGIEKWITNWKRNGWKTSTGEPVKNQDLWRRLDAVRTGETQFMWVKAHATDEMNLRVDALARQCAGLKG
jgi:ribonuclease HI